MDYCKKCIMPHSRPGLEFDADGVCAACRWHEIKKTINWHQRDLEFANIAAEAKRTSKSSWDCVLGVSGGKDSTWQAFQLREKYGLRALLVQYVSSDGTEVGRQNIENLISHGFDLISFQPNPVVAAKLSKTSFLKYGNVQKYAEMALFPAPWRVAMAHDIPLVLFGENPALEAGDKNKGDGWDASTIRNNNTLSGGGADIWLGNGIESRDLIPYRFPSEADFGQWNGSSIFMGYYLNWSGWKNGVFAINKGMQITDADYADIGIHYKHNSLDSDYGGIVNSMLKSVKLGFGHTTEFACYDIRDGRLSRAEAALLVRELDGRCHPRYIESYCHWAKIDINEFHRVADSLRGPMWQEGSDGRWQLDNPIWEQEDLSGLAPIEAILDRVDTRKFALKPNAGEI